MAAVARHYARVDVVRAPVNLGAAGRNAGVRACTTPYVAFCDDDTWWLPESLVRAADVLDRHPTLAAVTARVLVGETQREDPTNARMATSPLPNTFGLHGSELLGLLAGACIAASRRRTSSRRFARSTRSKPPAARAVRTGGRNVAEGNRADATMAPGRMTRMRTIGLLGGMSFESTIPYYRIVNETVRERLGGLHSARIALVSVDFDGIERLQRTGDWGAAGRMLGEAAQRVEAAGADLLVLCTNTMHIVAGDIAGAVSIPLLHIADPTADAIRAAGLRRVALLGTRFTMEQDFYRARLRGRGIESCIPDDAGREWMHRVIYEELCRGIVRDESRARLRTLIDDLVAGSAEGVILGCTEIAMLIDAGGSRVPIFDTARLHAQAAALLALED